jgi:PAS domain S-box-containing protein
VLWLLALHVVPIFAYALHRGYAPFQATLAAAAVAGFAVVGAIPMASRTIRAMVGSLGLLACSALLAQLSGGLTELQFHLFVSLAIITLYQEWVPFLGSVIFVLLHHGLVGAFYPEAVYSHPDAAAHPWRYAIVHAGFVAAACGAYTVQWRLNEDLRDDSELLLESAGEGILGIDMDGRIRFANPAALAILGRSGSSLVGQPVAPLFPGLPIPSGEPVRRQVHEAMAAAEGKTVPVECILTSSVRRGLLRGHVLAFRDITERRMAEAERLRSREEQVQRLREVDEIKTQFLRNAAHELRTPLTPLGLQVELLKMRLGEDPAHKEDAKSLEILGRNFERLQSLIEDMLSVTRLDARKVVLRREPVELVRALHEAHDTFEPLALRQHIRLEVSCEPGLWVHADPMRLNQVLFNLIANALRYTERGTVRVEALLQGDHACVSVTDTGRGLSAQQIGRLFQPFGQVHDGVAAERVGTGLGLYITRSLVELHGGRIWVDSAGPGQGSRFTFTLPACPTPVEGEATRAAAAAPGPGPAKVAAEPIPPSPVLYPPGP